MNLSNENSLIECLRELGLSDRESRVYLALLRKRHATVTELQQLSHVPQSKMYETLNSMKKYGLFLERREGHLRVFEIIDPKISLARHFENLEQRIQNAQTQKSRIENFYADNNKSFAPLEYVEMMQGSEAIHFHYCNAIRKTNQELLVFVRPPYACYSPEKVDEQTHEYVALIKRGGTCRWVYELSSTDQSVQIETLRKARSKGIQIRLVENLPLKMIVFDQQQVMFMQENPLTGGRDETIMGSIRQSAIANAFHNLFEYFWHSSIDFDKWKQNTPLKDFAVPFPLQPNVADDNHRIVR